MGVWVWVCGCVGVGVWVCGCVGVWVCGCVGVGVWVFGGVWVGGEGGGGVCVCVQMRANQFTQLKALLHAADMPRFYSGKLTWGLARKNWSKKQCLLARSSSR